LESGREKISGAKGRALLKYIDKWIANSFNSGIFSTLRSAPLIIQYLWQKIWFGFNADISCSTLLRCLSQSHKEGNNFKVISTVVLQAK